MQKIVGHMSLYVQEPVGNVMSHCVQKNYRI